MRARVPGSTANLGPGFDTLALALNMYVDVELEPADSLEIISSGEGAHLPLDGDHLAARVAREVIGHDRLKITIDSQVPVGRGLGSSAAVAVATAAAAGAEDPLSVALDFEGHPENAAASVMGGLVTVAMVDGQPIATPLFLDPDLHFVVLVPAKSLSTKKAREVLPKEVSLTDASFNLGRLGWLIAALGDASGLRPEVMNDRLHQNSRSALFPESQDLIDELVRSGAGAACWSGAGPTMLALCVGQEKAERVRSAGEKALADLGIEGVSMTVAADTGGIQVE